MFVNYQHCASIKVVLCFFLGPCHVFIVIQLYKHLCIICLSLFAWPKKHQISPISVKKINLIIHQQFIRNHNTFSMLCIGGALFKCKILCKPFITKLEQLKYFILEVSGTSFISTKLFQLLPRRRENVMWPPTCVLLLNRYQTELVILSLNLGPTLSFQSIKTIIFQVFLKKRLTNQRRRKLFIIKKGNDLAC